MVLRTEAPFCVWLQARPCAERTNAWRIPVEKVLDAVKPANGSSMSPPSGSRLDGGSYTLEVARWLSRGNAVTLVARREPGQAAEETLEGSGSSARCAWAARPCPSWPSGG